MHRFPWFCFVAAVLLFIDVSTVLVGQQFDEQFELWPLDLKIQGTVIAGGGGEMPTAAIDRFKSELEKDQSRLSSFDFKTRPTSLNQNSQQNSTRLKRRLNSRWRPTRKKSRPRPLNH